MSEIVRFPRIPSMDRPSSIVSGAFLGTVSSLAPWALYGQRAGLEAGVAVEELRQEYSGHFSLIERVLAMQHQAKKYELI